MRAPPARWRGGRPCATVAALALLAGCVGFEPVPVPDRPDEAVRLPPGFALDVFARDLGHPRALAVDPGGTLVVSVPRTGRVLALPDRDGDGRAEAPVPVIEGLELPHGLAFHAGWLYVAETGRILRVRYDPRTRQAAGPLEVVVPDLPARGAHWTRTIAIGPDGHLYVSVGSSCDVCQERDRRRAAITRYAADGSGERPFATGLRNAVGLAFRPGTAELWAAVTGRDWLGDDRPPDLVTRVTEGGFYGWPYCVFEGDRAVPDPDLGGGPGRCETVARPSLTLEAHSAPLGLSFYTGTQFPAEYRDNLFVALHGSWNRTVPAGHKVIRVRFDQGRPRAEDFATGWLAGRRAWGRPADVAVGADGSLFVSDDAGGVVYRIRWATSRR
jgi:glucose/arabinose dehydrogenase